MDLGAKTLVVASSNCVMSVLYGIMPGRDNSLSKKVVLTFE